MIAVGLTAACGTSSGTETGTASNASAAVGGSPAGTVTETGSGLLYPLIKIWAQAYHQQVPGVTVTTASTGSGTGLADATSGTVDIGASDAYLSSGDLLRNPNLLNIPLAVSAQTVIYNVPGLSQQDHLQLSGAVLAGMYSGAITMWNDPRIQVLNGKVSLPATRIVPLHRDQSSGDTFLFTSYLSTQDATWSNSVGYGTLVAWPKIDAAQGVTGSVTMMQTCAATPGCVGYNGVSYLAQALATGKIGEAAVENGGGHYTIPTAGAIQSEVDKFVPITPPNETIAMIAGPGGFGYPLVNYEYAIVSTRQRSAAKATMIKDFLTWVIKTGNGASYLSQVGFQPLPPEIQTMALAQVERIG